MQLSFHPHPGDFDPGRRVDLTAQLQYKRQMLQAEKLLFQATAPDGASLPTEDIQRSLDRKLEETAAELRVAKVDRYEPEAHAGLSWRSGDTRPSLPYSR